MWPLMTWEPYGRRDTGTAECRVPDELRRHSLSDGVGGSYSTNLDRNRYGNDDQYLSTVIRCAPTPLARHPNRLSRLLARPASTFTGSLKTNKDPAPLL